MESQENIFLPKHITLINFSVWTNAFAYICLFLTTLLIAPIGFVINVGEWIGQNYRNLIPTNIAEVFTSMMNDPFLLITVIGDLLTNLLGGAFYFVVLRGISLGLNILVETDVNYRLSSEQGKSK